MHYTLVVKLIHIEWFTKVLWSSMSQGVFGTVIICVISLLNHLKPSHNLDGLRQMSRQRQGGKEGFCKGTRLRSIIFSISSRTILEGSQTIVWHPAGGFWNRTVPEISQSILKLESPCSCRTRNCASMIHTYEKRLAVLVVVEAYGWLGAKLAESKQIIEMPGALRIVLPPRADNLPKGVLLAL